MKKQKLVAREEMTGREFAVRLFLELLLIAGILGSFTVCLMSGGV